MPEPTRELPSVSFEQLFERILERQDAGSPNSYVARLTGQGTDAILQKVGEEAVELVIAGKNADRNAALHELADLWFHMMVWMAAAGHSLDDLRAELGRRYRPDRDAESAGAQSGSRSSDS